MEANYRGHRAGDVAGDERGVTAVWERLKSRLRFYLWRRAMEQEIERELRAHVELEEEEQQEAGVAAKESRYGAWRALGNTARIAEDVREVWSFAWVEKFLRDVRYGARSLRKSPGFAAVAILTLAMGTGANTAIFSMIDAVLLRPLPFPDADQLVRISSTKDGALITGYAYPGGPSYLDVQDFAQGNHSFQKMVAYDTWRKNVRFGSDGAEPEEMRIGLVPPAYFEISGIQPLRGRFFTKEEQQEGKDFVAAISERLWKSRFGGDEAILGRKIWINDEPYTIVALMPDAIPDWMELAVVEIWTPITFSGENVESARGGRGYATLGRLKPGVTLEQAQADLATIAAKLATEHPVDQGVGVQVRPLVDTRAGTMRPMLLLLAGAVSLILLIACVNLGNLLLARNSARQRELAVRTALGAGRGELVRQLLAETLLLALIGGVAGLGVTHWGVAALLRSHARELPQLGLAAFDWRVLAFTLIVSLATILLFGLGPAFAGTRVNLIDSLKQGGRTGTAERHAYGMRKLLVVSEMAMTLMLLVGAGLLIQSLARLQTQVMGIRQDHLLKGRFYLPPVRYVDAGAITRFCDEFGARVRALPGVVDASITTAYPPRNGWTQMLGIPGRPATRIQDIPEAQFGVADRHFLRTMGIPLLRGRDFSATDTATSAPVALISEELRRHYVGAADAIGQRIHIGPPEFMKIPVGANTTDDADVTIVGVVGDFKNAGLAAAPEPHNTVLYARHPLVNYGFKDIVIRTSGDPHLLAAEIGRQLHGLDADLPFSDVRTFDEAMEQQTGGQRFTTLLLSLFALAGLVLAVVGVYGVTSYLMARRMKEMAVRLALGATPGNILWLVIRQGLSLAIVGSVIGLGGALAVRRLTGGLPFGISAVDPVTLLGGAIFMLCVTFVACAIPGTRAMMISLVEVLRED